MEATNITGAGGTLNRQAKSAARSAFESTKQRFFNHVLTSMKTLTLLRAVEQDLAAGHAAVVQIVSTGEALTGRRLAEIPTEEWGDVQVDTTPRDGVMQYLLHAFPVQLYEPFYRLQTDAGERIIGRRVSATWAANATAPSTSAVSPTEAHAALLQEAAVIELAGGLRLRRSRVMGVHRIELTGASEAMRDQLKSFGLFSEIIAWTLRLFVPVEAGGSAVLARLLEAYPVVRLSARETA